MKAPPVLLLARSAIAKLATTRDYLAAMQTAFADLAHGRFEVPHVGHVPGVGGMFHIKSAQRGGSHALAAIKVNGNFPENVAQRKLPTIQGFVALLDAECGCVLALMDSIEITARRTAAATALAAKYLAKPGSRTLAMIGCGVQARYHVEALLDVAPIESVAFYDPREDAADAFAERVRELGLQVQRAGDARTAVRSADIVVTVTTSTRPLLRLADIGPGTFVAGVGADNPSKHELAPDLLKASRVIVDSRAQASTMGDLHHAIEAGAMQAANVRGELAELAAGQLAGRAHADELWVFDSTGLSIQDLAAAEMIYERARAAGSVPQIELSN
ncbi:MAG TPA: ornithine cyclodeaminase family protein [Steroidobacteraceae bacterium]|nr:ornithine cyclodeaminase family protein [Steroidobacteraceae bacterium]